MQDGLSTETLEGFSQVVCMLIAHMAVKDEQIAHVTLTVSPSQSGFTHLA